VAVAINNVGTVLGYAITYVPDPPHFAPQGFLQTATGFPKLFPLSFPLPFPPYSSLPGSINNRGAGVIQDRYVTLDATGEVVVTPINLGACVDVTAVAINDRGWVTGSCTVPGEPPSGFLWRP
jgi:hypothetical protein